MKLLVTGAAGFIGSTLTDALLARGDEVIGLDNFNDYYSPARKRANLAVALANPRFRLVEGDFTDGEAMKRLLNEARPDLVAHLGALGSVRYSVKRPDLYVANNIAGTANLLEAAALAGTRKFLFASTSSVYGQTQKIPFVETDPTDRPLAPYPATKKAGEVLCHAYHNMHGMEIGVVRFFNVYGPRGRPDMMPYIVLESLLADEEITLYDNGDMRRDWTYVDDIVAGVIAAADRIGGYEVYNLGRGEPVLMTEFLKILEDITGRKARIRAVPAPASEPKVTFADVTKSRDRLGYNPQTTVRQGLERFCDWHREFH